MAFKWWTSSLKIGAYTTKDRMELDLLRLSLLGIGVLVLLIVYWFNRPRSRSSPPPERITEQTTDEILGIDRPISAVDDPLESEDLHSELESLKRVISDEQDESVSGSEGAAAPDGRPRPQRAEETAPSELEETEPVSFPEDKIIALYLVARSPEGLSGERLFAAAESAGLRYGELKIYHHLRDGEQQFGMANLVEPGYFDPAQAETFTTPGISFFLQLPGPSKPLRAFDDLVAVVEQMAKALDAEVWDGQRRPIGPEAVARLRREVEAYEVTPVT
jgi:cell division protein ZipA